MCMYNMYMFICMYHVNMYMYMHTIHTTCHVYKCIYIYMYILGAPA